MKSLFPLAALALLATVAAPAMAAPAPNWAVDKTKSRVAFIASMNGQPINGSFRRFDTRIAFDPANLAGSSVVTVIYTGTAVTGDAGRDESLPTPDWFNVAAFPHATFTSKTFKNTGPNRYTAIGTLTIRGVKRTIALPFQLVINGNVARMQGSLAVDRRWFGVGQGQFATPDSVAAKVVINITLSATKAR